MNRPVYFILLAICGLLWMGFLYDRYKNSIYPVESSPQKVEMKNGPVKGYDTDGDLKTIVNYKYGIKEGFSYLYHKDGKTVQLALPYENGKRQGTSKKYFETGKLYATTSYENDKIHGTRKVYYRTGQIKSEVPYGNGFKGIGLVEYLAGGEKKSMPKIEYSQKSNIIYFNTSEPCKKTRFFIGSLIEGAYFDHLSKNLHSLPKRDNFFYLDLTVFTPSYLKFQDIICACESSQGNTIILKKRIDTSSIKTLGASPQGMK